MTFHLLSEEEDSLETLIEDYKVAKDQAEEAKNRADALAQKLKDKMREEGRKSKTIDWGGKNLRVVYSSKTNLVINEAGLKKAIGARAFRKVAVEKVDRTKLNAAVESGDLDETVVKQYVTNEPRPEVRLYVVKDTEEDQDES